jgi:DNA end-binding protein Ku
MARPIWKGSISFGLVNVPVVLYSAEKRKELHFKMLDSRNLSPIRYERKNEKTGEEVPWNDIVKGYEYSDGEYVLLGDEDFKRAAVESTQTVEIQDFVDSDSVEYVYFDKPYYLVPGNKGEKGYVLLRETLRRTKKAGVAKVVIRTRQYLAALLVQGDALVLNLLRFHDELRDPGEFEFPSRKVEEHKINPKELQMAERLVESMKSKWDPAKYKDDYSDALLKWIEQKAERGETKPAPAVRGRKAEEAAAGTINIMDLLKKSVEHTEKTRAPARKPAKPAPKGGKRKRAS